MSEEKIKAGGWGYLTKDEYTYVEKIYGLIPNWLIKCKWGMLFMFWPYMILIHPVWLTFLGILTIFFGCIAAIVGLYEVYVAAFKAWTIGLKFYLRKRS